MNTASWLLLLTACSALCALTWWACALARLNQELKQKLRKTTQLASAELSHSRKQIRQLKKDLAAQQEAHRQLLAGREARKAGEERRAAALRDALPTPVAFVLPSSGFEDTAPMF